MTMETVYIIMCQKGKNDPRNYIFASTEPYAVFNNKNDAERMKREGDYIVEVPYIHSISLSIPNSNTTGKVESRLL